jgi:putative tricarboxylic transport membrane protein
MHSDRWLGPAISVLALAWMALVYALVPAGTTDVEPGPRGFPVLLGVVMLAVGLLMTASGLASARGSKGDQEKPVTGREVSVVAATFGILMLYAFLMDKLGFLIATPIAVLLMMVGILRMLNWLFVGLMTAGITAACWLLFVKLLGAPMPQGSWLWLL